MHLCSIVRCDVGASGWAGGCPAIRYQRLVLKRTRTDLHAKEPLPPELYMTHVEPVKHVVGRG